MAKRKSGVSRGPPDSRSTPAHAASLASPRAEAEERSVESQNNLSVADRANLEKIKAAFSAPIDFFGRVLDESGHPVTDAEVYYSVADRYFGKTSQFQGRSDSQGLFSKQGMKGAGVYVEVSKAGYGRLPGKSYASFGYGVPSGNRPPSKEYPAIFVLRKKGPSEPLVVISSRQFKISKTGEGVGVDLKSGQRAGPGNSQIQVQSWVDNNSKDEHNHFDWKCRISIPEGGLLERQGTAFEAPEDGYKTFDEIAESQASANWKDSAQREYFVRLKDNTYAHMKFQMMAGGSYNFFVLESYLNPQPGSRNLEYDPAKAIKAK